MAYASKYYDPKKAHEYYMKHRKLKGRRSTKGMSQQQKELVAYTRHGLQEEKKKKKQDITNWGREYSQNITASAKARRQKISQMSKAQKQAILAKAQATREMLSSQAKQKVQGYQGQA